MMDLLPPNDLIPFSHLSDDQEHDVPALVGSVPLIEQYRRFFPESFFAFIQKNKLEHRTLPEIQKILQLEREIQRIPGSGGEQSSGNISADIYSHYDSIEVMRRLVIVNKFYDDSRNRTCDFLLSQPNWGISEFDRKTVAATLHYIHGCRTLFDIFIIAGMDVRLLDIPEEDDTAPPHYYTCIHRLHALSVATLDEITLGADMDPFVEEDWLGDRIFDAPWIRRKTMETRTKVYLVLSIIGLVGGGIACYKNDISSRVQLQLQQVGDKIGNRLFGPK